MSDKYAVIRTSTLAWLLERARLEGELKDIPEAVAVDLGKAVVKVDAPTPAVERLRALGPVLSDEQHLELLAEDEQLELPRGRGQADFWHLVARIVHRMMMNEAEAVARLIGVEDAEPR